MFYVSKANSGSEIYVTDTNDGVVEKYTYQQLKNICDTSNIEIYGFRRNSNDYTKYSINPCKLGINGVLLEVSRQDNTFYIHSQNGKCEKFNVSSKIHNDRNDVYLDGSFSILSKFRSNKGYTLISLNAWVKYDVEFCGIIYILVSNKYGWVEDYTDVIFTGDYSDEELEQFCGDCPTFTDRDEFPFSLKNGVFKGKNY